MDEWKDKFLAWIREPTPQALLNANIVFDFRPLSGNTTLCDALREWLFGYTQANPLFLRFLVQNALDVEPPLGLIRTFVLDDARRQGDTRPRRAVRGCSSTVPGSSHSRWALPTRGRPRGSGTPASACTSPAGMSMRRSRRFSSCNCCGCVSRTSRACPENPIVSIPTDCTRSTSGC
jgi:hypothetical protein